MSCDVYFQYNRSMYMIFGLISFKQTNLNNQTNLAKDESPKVQSHAYANIAVHIIHSIWHDARFDCCHTINKFWLLFLLFTCFFLLFDFTMLFTVTIHDPFIIDTMIGLLQKNYTMPFHLLLLFPYLFLYFFFNFFLRLSLLKFFVSDLFILIVGLEFHVWNENK